MNASFLSVQPALGWIVTLIVSLVILAGVGYEMRLLLTKRRGDLTVTAGIRRIGICILLVVCLWCPSTLTATSHRAIHTMNVMMLVDTTTSMNVQDVSQDGHTITRIDAAKRVMSELIKSYPNANFAALRFGSSTSLDVPITPDAQAMQNWITTLRTENPQIAQGTSLDAPLDQTLLTLKAISQAHSEDTNIVYVLSDGEETVHRTRRTFSSLRAYAQHAFVIGLGSQQGGKIPAGSGLSREEQSSQPWIIDPQTGKPGISRMNERNLRAIADELSGSYVSITNNPRAIDTLKHSANTLLSKQFRDTLSAKPRMRPEPMVWPFAGAIAILLTWEMAAWLHQSRKLL